MRIGMQQVLDSWRTCRNLNIPLSLQYLGKHDMADKLGKPESAGNKKKPLLCYKIESIRGEPEGVDHVVRAVFFISVDELLLLSSELYDANNALIATYQFKDVELNPEFKDWQFQEAAFEK
jgi:hypothetical protein